MFVKLIIHLEGLKKRGTLQSLGGNFGTYLVIHSKIIFIENSVHRISSFLLDETHKTTWMFKPI